MRDTIQNHIKDGSLTNHNGTNITITSPLTITVSGAVISQLNSLYKNNIENGGLLAMKITGIGVATIEGVELLNNTSTTATTFEPSTEELNYRMIKLINLGYLPIIFHTHPTTIGQAIYDRQKPNFYLRASQTDINTVKQGIDIDGAKLLLPECIFVKSEKYTNGFMLSIYGGGIMPNSYSRLTTAETYAVIGGCILFFVGKLNLLALSIAGIIFLKEERKRPTYQFINEQFTISINK